MLPTPDWSAYMRRITDEHAAGWISRAARDVLRALAALIAAGDATPTVAQIAALAHASPRTVRRARAAAEARGLLEVAPRYVVEAGRSQQRANRYELRAPAGPIAPKPRGGQAARGSQVRKIRKAPRDAWPEVGIDLLAARRAVWAGRAGFSTLR